MFDSFCRHASETYCLWPLVGLALYGLLELGHRALRWLVGEAE